MANNPSSQNSVRHNLSLNPCFEKIPRPLTDRGKGAYWIVNDKIDPRSGVHRERKKKTNRKKESASPETDERVAGPSGSTGPPAGIEMKEGGAMPYMVIDQEGNRIAYAAWPG